MTNISTNKDFSVSKKHWHIVESLPFGGPYANHQNGFNDHKDPQTGKVYRVKFSTFTSKKKVSYLYTESK